SDFTRLEGRVSPHGFAAVSWYGNEGHANDGPPLWTGQPPGWYSLELRVQEGDLLAVRIYRANGEEVSGPPAYRRTVVRGADAPGSGHVPRATHRFGVS